MKIGYDQRGIEMMMNLGVEYDVDAESCVHFRWDTDEGADFAYCRIGDDLHSCPCMEHIEETGEPYECDHYMTAHQMSLRWG